MNLLSKIWLSASFLFEPVQRFFNGNFWQVFEKKFGRYTNRKVIDIACGTGELRRHINPKEYLGIDINKSYIYLCNRDLGNKNTRFLLVDANKFFPDERFDTTFFIGSLHHFSDKQATRLFSSISKYKTNEIIVLDGIPFGIFEGILRWLDGVLGGGKYFRTENEIVKILKGHFKIIKQERISAKNSFYFYPYWILKPLKK